MRKLIVLGLAVLALAGGSAVADPRGTDAPPAPGWTTAIMPGGEVDTNLFLRGEGAAALGKGSSQPKPANLESGTYYKRDGFGCRYYLQKRSSVRWEIKKHCLIGHSQ